MFTSTRRGGLLFLNFLPALFTLLMAIISLSSWPVLLGLRHFMPLLAMIPVFYWGMARAREMPYWFVFLLGLINDAVTGQPLGLSSLLYLLFLTMIRAQRKYIHKEGFLVQWVYFGVLLFAMCALNWLALSLFYAQAAAIFPALLQWGVTVCCYPVLHIFCTWVFDTIGSRRWQMLQGS